MTTRKPEPLTLAERLTHAELCLMNVDCPEDAEAVRNARERIAQVERERDEAQEQRDRLAQALADASAEMDEVL
jgi:septal ring factor EnvC (AmiA/AmiB activator)